MKFLPKVTKHAFIYFLSSALLACGGGGGGSPSGNSNNGGNVNFTIDMAITNFSLPSASLVAGNSYDVSITIENRGSGINSPGTSVSLSLVNTYNRLTITPLGISLPTLVIAAGSNISDTLNITIPPNLRTGTYFLHADAPINPDAPDVTPDNNRAVIQIEVIGTSCTADTLEEDDSPSDASPLSIGESLNANLCEDTDDWFIFNAVKDEIYNFEVMETGLKSDLALQLYDQDGTTLLNFVTIGDSSGADIRMLWKAIANGTYYLRALGGFSLADTGPDTEYSISMSDKVPDIVMSSNSVLTSANTGDVISVETITTNAGAAGTGSIAIIYYISSDSTIDSSDRLISFDFLSNIDAGNSNIINSRSLTIPANIDPGDYFIGAFGDDGNALLESNELNNTWAIPITIN